MAKQITKITDTNVALIETVERKRVYSKKELDEEKTELEKKIADVDELLAALV